MEWKGWTKMELNATPMCDVLSILFILNRRNIQAEKKGKEKEKEK